MNRLLSGIGGLADGEPREVGPAKRRLWIQSPPSGVANPALLTREPEIREPTAH